MVQKQSRPDVHRGGGWRFLSKISLRRSSFAIAIAAVQLGTFTGLKRQFRYRRSALGAFPIALIHLLFKTTLFFIIKIHE